MTMKEAIKILMESPMYFRLQIVDRLVLVQELCQSYTVWN